jgi:hypothetical protein
MKNKKVNIADEIVSAKKDAYRPALPHIKVKDPLSEVTRKERRSLLGVSLIGLAVAKVGLLPEEITTFGIKFAAQDKGGLLHLLVFIISFYLIAFLIYALSDFVTWRLAFIDEIKRLMKEDSESPDGMFRNLTYLQHKWNSVSTTTSVIRALFEFLIPIAIAAYSIIVLLSIQVK